MVSFARTVSTTFFDMDQISEGSRLHSGERPCLGAPNTDNLVLREAASASPWHGAAQDGGVQRIGRVWDGWGSFRSGREHAQAFSARLFHLSGGRERGAWRVVAGTVRLDRGQDGDGNDALASLAVVGDIIGAETLLFGRYTFTARALSDCTLIPWNEYGERPGHEGLLKALARAEQRFADILALRTGRAADRVARLLSIMSFGVVGRRTLAGQVLPRLRDIAEITGLTIETVSRTIKQLRGEGLPGLTGGQSTAEKEEDASGR